MQDQPKPSVALIAASILVIAGSLFLVSVGVAAPFTFDPCFIFTAMLFTPLPALLAIQQYRGTFRSTRSAAKASAVSLFAISGFLAFALAVNLGEAVLSGDNLQFDTMFVLLMILLISLSCGVAGWLNLRWMRTLTAATGPREKWRFSIKEMLIATAVIACMTAFITSLTRSSIPQYAEHVDRDHAPSGIPEGATDISYFRRHRGGIAYEFTIDEAGFRRWIESMDSHRADVPLTTISSPTEVTRYFNLHPGISIPDEVIVHTGLEYEWTDEHGGVHAVFDATTDRAYYYAYYD